MTKIAPEKLRKDFLSIDFNLNDKFCDVNDLSYSWQSLPISDGMLAFFYPFSASTQQNILIHIEQTLKLKMTITEILMTVTKILQPVVVLLLQMMKISKCPTFSEK